MSYSSVKKGNPVGSAGWFTDVFYFQLYLKNWKMQHHWTSPGLGTLGKTSSCLTLWYIYIPHHLVPALPAGACKLRCIEETGRYREERSKPKWDLSASQTGGTVLHPNLAAYTQIQSINIIWEQGPTVSVFCFPREVYNPNFILKFPLFFSLFICYYHQELHLWSLHPGLHPGFAAPCCSLLPLESLHSPGAFRRGGGGGRGTHRDYARTQLQRKDTAWGHRSIFTLRPPDRVPLSRLPAKAGMGCRLQLHPFSGRLDSAGELLHTALSRVGLGPSLLGEKPWGSVLRWLSSVQSSHSVVSDSCDHMNIKMVMANVYWALTLSPVLNILNGLTFI